MQKNTEKAKVRTYRDLNVFQQSFELAHQIFLLTQKFPPEEKYNMIDQTRRAARSIPANIAEGWAKRKYENVFKRHLVDVLGSCEEIKVWLDMARRCGYLSEGDHRSCASAYIQVSSMLTSLLERWKSYS